ncbi:X-X-X-Leu-X-X-Gly heptad repeats [Dorea longicatena]|uniref:X-X-X-Leu-X-X-Gly heptad repeats n=1 Tax=Dorea longicatena TaxID=88431 RepID=A0A173TLR4_9FIRM|nr:hypothetical protein [Dorea longicatena]CUN03340.1 X-X-X-Leu-X-X-Gly heptad repeats [Dorea longicatena]
MNKNRKMKRKIAASVAVGMSVMMGVTPAFAASGTSDSDVYKEETVYVNAKASGKTDKVTVSNWLKNSGSVSGNLEDESILSDIKNVKGDEKYTADGDKLTWSTDSEDIYYQGTTDKKLPVSVKLKYYLDGKEMKPSELKGKSGHLKITVDYKNNEKKNVSVDGKDTEVYTPFVMMTGMILPNETFSNVTIDNGKIISDGNKNIVVGFGMPGLKDSLNLSSEETDKVTIPESLSIEADVKDFTMSSTYTVALSDLLDDVDMDSIVNVDDLQNALDDLEDAALQLVSGSDTLADGAGTLADGVNSYTEGVDTLNAGIQKYLGSNGELNGSVTEYVNGVNKVVKGVQDYTSGVNTLADGVSSYVDGEKQLAEGASQLTQLSTGLKKVQSAIAKMEASTDGKGKDREDIKVASSELAAGTQALEDSLGTKQVQALMAQVGSMVQTGNELIAQTEQLESGMQKGVKEPVTNIVKELTVLQKELDGLNTQLTNLKTTCESKVTELNTAIDDYNNKVAAAKNVANTSSEKISQSIQALETQKSKASSDVEKQQLQQSIDALKNAKTAADGLKNVNTVEKASISIDNIDTSDITKGIITLTGNLQTASKTMEGLGSQLGEMQTKLDTITAAKDKIPADQLNSLTSNITKLNAGMQGLDAGISELAAGISTLDSETSAQFPTAIQGITALNKGFAQLSGYNDSLVSGANKLKSNSPTLVAGVNTLQSGTNQLASGLNTLGSQMSSGSATLAANSGALRSGASELQSGAKELAEGMAKFDKEGTSKLKSTVEDELGDVLDRIDVLTSENCKYSTFSGKDKAMDGNVKFVIETDAIE